MRPHRKRSRQLLHESSSGDYVDEGSASDWPDVLTDKQLLERFGYTLNYVEENLGAKHLRSNHVRQWLDALRLSDHPQAKRTLRDEDRLDKLRRRVKNRDSAKASRDNKMARIRQLEQTQLEYQEFKKLLKLEAEKDPEKRLGQFLAAAEKWRLNRVETITSLETLLRDEQKRAETLEQANKHLQEALLRTESKLHALQDGYEQQHTQEEDEEERFDPAAVAEAERRYLLQHEPPDDLLDISDELVAD
jgi:hypothetical protein